MTGGMDSNSWLSRPVWMLAVALVLFAAALFVEWPGWWGGLLALAGAAVLFAWARGYGTSRAAWREDRRTTQRDRRRAATRVDLDRRTTGDRRLSGTRA